jgi:(2Fe-2S) ferredoxin
VGVDRVAEIIEKHVVGGEVVEELARKRLGPA